MDIESMLLIIIATIISYAWGLVFINELIYGLILGGLFLFTLRILYPKLTDNFLWILGVPLGILLAIGVHWIL